MEGDPIIIDELPVIKDSMVGTRTPIEIKAMVAILHYLGVKQI